MSTTESPQPAHLTPVARARENGHTVEWDPPAGLTAARRWTCTQCGGAVLDYDGNIYGQAVEATCDEVKAFWAKVSE